MVVDDSESVGVQMTAKLSNNNVCKLPDHFQIVCTVIVFERRCLVLVSFVGSRAHMAHQIHLRIVQIIDYIDRTNIHTDWDRCKISKYCRTLLGLNSISDLRSSEMRKAIV